MRSIAPLIQLGLGGFIIYSGVTGQSTLRGVDDPVLGQWALVAIGALVVAYGMWRVVRERRRQEALRQARAAAPAEG